LPHDSCLAWKRARLVTTVHDIKPLLFPTLASRASISRRLERTLVGDKWARIDHIITDSECSRHDITKRLPVTDDRLTVVYPGIDLKRFRPSLGEPRFDVRDSKSVGQKTSSFQLRTGSARPFVLSVAGADPTKNVGSLVEAFGRLPQSVRDAHDLVLVGDFRRRPELRERVVALGVEKQTEFPGVVSDERLIELYQQAALFVFPSRYEGFGLPVLEAMACGCPVISSNASSLPEVTGDAALLVDPMDMEGLAKKMNRVLSDQTLSDDMRKRGPIRASQFTWDRTAREIVVVYRKVLEGSCVS